MSQLVLPYTWFDFREWQIAFAGPRHASRCSRGCDLCRPGLRPFDESCAVIGPHPADVKARRVWRSCDAMTDEELWAADADAEHDMLFPPEELYE